MRRVVAMEIFSGIGDGAFWVALVALLIRHGYGAGGLALAAAVRLGPRALISAPAGVLADRVDRRRLLVGLDLVRAVVMAAVTVAAAAGAGAAVLLAGTFVAYTLAAPYRPALTAAMPSVAGESRLASANALIGTTRQLMTFIGPVIGVAIVAWSPTAAFAANAASFLIAAALIGSVGGLGGRRSGEVVELDAHRATWLGDLADGWTAVKATAGLRTITSLVFAMYVARGAELIFFALLAEERLDLGDSGVGILTGAVGLGAG